MPSREHTRRHILGAGFLTLIGVAGCLSSNSPSESPASETDETAQTPQTQQSRQSASTTAGLTDGPTRSDPVASDALVIESRHAIDGTMVNLGAEGTARNTASRALVECVIDVSGDIGGETYTARATRDRLEPDETWEWSVTFGDGADASTDDSVEGLSVETRAMYAE